MQGEPGTPHYINCLHTKKLRVIKFMSTFFCHTLPEKIPTLGNGAK